MTETALAVQENGKQQQTSLSLDIRQVEAQIQQFVPVLREIVTNGKTQKTVMHALKPVRLATAPKV